MRTLHYLFHCTIYYIAWITCLLLAAKDYAWLSTGIVLLSIAFQYYWQRYIAHDTRGLTSLTILLTVVGTLVDSVLMHAKLIVFLANPFFPYLSPPWMISIWISFSIFLFSTLGSVFNYLFVLSVLSFFGFAIAYAAGAKINAAHFTNGYATSLLIGLIWMILLPLLILFYKWVLLKNVK